jgi:hypothetical protein
MITLDLEIGEFSEALFSALTPAGRLANGNVDIEALTVEIYRSLKRYWNHWISRNAQHCTRHSSHPSHTIGKAIRG